MLRTRVLLLMLLSTILLLFSLSAEARIWQKKEKKKEPTSAPAQSKKDTEKPFAEVTKGLDKIAGLFDFYFNKKDNQVYMAIRPEQLNKTFLCSYTRSAGDGSFYEGPVMGDEFPFELNQVGKKIQFVQINLRFRADSTSSMSRALQHSISKSIFASTNVASLPDSGGAFLIDLSPILVMDVENVSYMLGNEGKTGYRFDKDNSYFGTIKSFPQNSEIDVVLHFKTDKPNAGVTLSSPYSMLMTYHYSLSTLPETGYRPRLADDRVGYFTTIYQDYSALNTEEPYVRYIDRWHLEKKDPSAPLSEPKEPIVFWLENTTPPEYRDALRAGVLFWNKAFEEAGFLNAVVCKEMPDTADWDPADVRFNTIRWTVWPNPRYGAVGPHRANPFTGQIYDADITVVAGTVRNIFMFAENFVEPINTGSANSLSPFADSSKKHQYHFGEACDYGEESAKMAAEGLAILHARDPLTDKSELTKKYVNQYLTDLISHEVGHTLGLRHNFKASTVFSRAQQIDPEFISRNGIVNSVMEYTPPNLVPDGMPQGDFFQSTPGPYDRWAIEYGYKSIDAADVWAEKGELNKIASRASDPLLAFGTDEDCFGNGPRAIDPYVTQSDLGADPIEYWQMRVALSKELWSKLEREFEKPGQNYKKLRSVFAYGWGAFSNGGNNVARFIGGIRHNRDHIGDPNGRLPFQPVSAEKQKEAMKFLMDNIWSVEAFQFPTHLLNKLQPERMADFSWTTGQMERIDYPLHSQVRSVQTTPLLHIYNPTTLARLNDIELRYDRGVDVYTMSEVFGDVRKAIWTEVIGGTNVSSMRRNLQRVHLGILIDLVTNSTINVPEDARTLARVDLTSLKGSISNALSAGGLNTISRGHLEESLARINAALTAKLDYKI